MSKYRTSPDPNNTGMPKGIPFIIGNEAAERFSFYGMKTILAVFMTKYLWLMNDTPGQIMSDAAVSEKVHLFSSAVYLTPLLGAFISDAFFGKYRTIIWLSLVYCAGHAALALMGIQGEAAMWLIAGLALISLGAGGIKPCVSAHVGDQFGASNGHLVTKIFNYFYWSINLGAFLSTMLTPWLMEWYGPHVAFGVPGVLMGLATLVFWMGRNRFIHIPAGGTAFLKETFSPVGMKAIGKLSILFLFVAMFWALFDQTASRWIFQAREMDRNFMGVEWLESQVQAVNPILILTFIPLFTFIIYPQVGRVVKLTPLRKIGAGLFLMGCAFALSSTIQGWIDAGERPNIGWQILAYILLTAAEIMVSIVALEFSYTQAPRTMKSLILGLFLFSVSLGNLFTAGVNHYIQIPSPGATVQGTLQAMVDKDRTAAATETHPGADEQPGTADDLVFTLKFGEQTKVATPSKASLDLAGAKIEAWTEANGSKFPRPEVGAKELEGLQDQWGNALHYFLENSRTCRITSDGPDQKSKTQWDVGIRIGLKEKKEAKKASWTDALHPERPWLERRKEKINYVDETEKNGEKDSEFIRTSFAGGGERLEGASYYWFFTTLMFITAIIFMPYAFFYRGKTILQE
jgi:POT family proton-dependent oligopeptide transporter